MENYTIDCTGDCCVGDEVKFEKAIFSGRYPNSKFIGTETTFGKIIRDSYGTAKQQHTFTLKLECGKTMRIKGRNLYRNGTHRKPWKNEKERIKVLNEKHQRGEQARQAAYERKNDTTDY